MDEPGTKGPKARRVDAAGLEDRHPLLHPQQGPGGRELRENEAGPAGVAGQGREKFGQGRSAAWLRDGRHRQVCVAASFFSRAGIPAGDQAKPWIHTTRNAVVLLLFLFARVREQSQSGDSTARSSVARTKG